MSEIIYRKAEADDINRLVELRKLQLHDEGAESFCDITEQITDFYTRHLSDSNFISWVAVMNNEIIATSGLSFTEKPPYYHNPTGKIGMVSGMYTAPEHRRKGIARKMLEIIADEAKSHCCGVLQLTASDDGAKLYQNFGFRNNLNFYQMKI